MHLSGELLKLTGSLSWAAYSVLLGGQHTLSSALEGVFTSIAGIAAGVRLYGLNRSKTAYEEAVLRFAQFSGPSMHGCPS